MAPSGFERLLDGPMERGVRYLCVCIEPRHGALVFEGARGALRPDAPTPMTADARFHLATATKTMIDAIIPVAGGGGAAGTAGLDADPINQLDGPGGWRFAFFREALTTLGHPALETRA